MEQQKKDYVMGIDPGYKNMGVSVVTDDAAVMRLAKVALVGNIYATDNIKLAAVLEFLRSEFMCQLMYRVGVVYIEQQRRIPKNVALANALATGIATLYPDVQVMFIAPSVVKRLTATSTKEYNNNKKAVVQLLKQDVGVDILEHVQFYKTSYVRAADVKNIGKLDDVADAYVICKAMVQQHKNLKLKKQN